MDHKKITKEDIYKDYGAFSPKPKTKKKTPRPAKELHQCAKCGRVSDEMTRHSLAGEHKPPFIWLCRQPCHDQVHKFGIKMSKEEKQAQKRQLPCSIQFPKENNITNPYAQLIEPESLDEKFRQTFKPKNTQEESKK